MVSTLDPAAVRDVLQAGMKGRLPPADLLEQAGGWPALEVLASTLVNDPWLTPMMSLLARDANLVADSGEDLSTVASAAHAMVDAVLDSTDPLQFSQGLETVCTTPVLVELVGQDVADRCLALAGPPAAVEGEAAPRQDVVIRHAVALETATRLALQECASTYKVLGLFDDVREPQPVRYARAVTRSVSCAFDFWSPDDEVRDVIDILTGVTKPRNASNADAHTLARYEEYRLDVASDAIWAKANIEVARALRARTTGDMLGRLEGAVSILDQLHDRDDVSLLRAALTLLNKLVGSLSAAGSGPLAAEDWDLAFAEVEALAARAAELTFEMQGLSHWSADRKLVVLKGWARLACDLGWLREQLERDSLYEAAVVLDDLIEIYSASRAYDVVGIERGVERAMEVVRPAIVSGLAAKAGLVRHLSDHVENLQQRIAAGSASGDDLSILQRKVGTAQKVLDATRVALLTTVEPPGKSDKQATPLPSLLTEFLPPDVAEALDGVDEAALGELAADIANLQATTGLDTDLVTSQVRRTMLEAITPCEDFNGDVAVAVTKVLDQLIRFVATRMNTQKSYKAYLYDENSKEKPLQNDLYDWLHSGQLSGFTNMEVQEVAGGRVDIQIQFPGFTIYVELKADDTRVPIEEKAAYIKQTATYQATSVRIGFLVVLRTKAAKDRSLPQHLTDYVTHTTVKVDGSASERHVVMLEIPGGRTAPSAQK